MNGFTFEADSYSMSYFQRENTAFSSSNPIIPNSSFGFAEPFSRQKHEQKEVKKKRDLSSILDDFTYKLSLAVGTTIRRARYHLLNYCYSQHILSFPDGNISYNQYSIRIDQDKQYRVHRSDNDQLLSVDENEIILQFVDEVLILFDDASESICFQFIVTNDKVDGNGRVILHINPHPSRNLRSFQMDEFPSSSTLTRSNKIKPTLQPTTVSYASSINPTLFSKVPFTHNRSILSRTSLRSDHIQRQPPKASEEDLSVLLLTKPISQSATKTSVKKSFITWSEQESPSFENDHVSIYPWEGLGQRASESASAYSVDCNVYDGHTEIVPHESIQPSRTRQKSPSLQPSLKLHRTPIPKEVDELEGLFGHSKTTQQLPSVFSYGTALSIPHGQMTDEEQTGGDSDSENVFTEKEEESEVWVYQRNPEPLGPSMSHGADQETTSSVTPDISESGRKVSLLHALKGMRPVRRSKEESKTDDTDSSLSISFEGSSYSETVTSRRSHTSNSQSNTQAEYCQFFGCHRTIAAASSERNRCKRCAFLFCDEHKPRPQFVNGKEITYCDSCYNEMKKQVSTPRGKVIPEEPSRSSSILSDTSIDRKPVVVSFFSHPLGIDLQCGEDNRNARVLRFDRYDNNDNGMKVAIASYVLQINDNITIDMDYVSIVNLIKKSSFPITIIFGTLYDSVQRNIQHLLSIVEPKERTCNLALCSASVARTSPRKCAICERVYCKKHCRRSLFFDDDKPEYVCHFCFPCVFRPFDTKFIVQWVPDFMVHSCTEAECGVTFTSFNFSLRKRRHHCRLCGNVFCDKHCNKRVVLTEFGISDAVRVCNYCYLLIKKTREEM